MFFLISVRWHPGGDATPCTSQWSCTAFTLVNGWLEIADRSGIVVKIPALMIERIEAEQKG